jgi:hypothetical protein
VVVHFLFRPRPCTHRAPKLVANAFFEQPRELVSRIVLRHVVDVDHRRLNVGVAHECLHVGERKCLNRDRPERMTQVVEAKVPKAGTP